MKLMMISVLLVVVIIHLMSSTKSPHACLLCRVCTLSKAGASWDYGPILSSYVFC